MSGITSGIILAILLQAATLKDPNPPQWYDGHTRLLSTTILNERGPVKDSGWGRIVVYPPTQISPDDIQPGKRCYFVYLYSDDAANYERIEWCSEVEEWCIPRTSGYATLAEACEGRMHRRRKLKGPTLTCSGKGCEP